MSTKAAWIRSCLSSRSSTLGCMPLLSILMGRLKDLRSRSRSSRPGTRVGSPPLITMPSSQACRDVRKRSTDSRGRGENQSGRQANSALWQVGQRRLQPPMNRTHAVFPGQSQRLMGSIPRTEDQGAVMGSPDGGLWGWSGSVHACLCLSAFVKQIVLRAVDLIQPGPHVTFSRNAHALAELSRIYLNKFDKVEATVWNIVQKGFFVQGEAENKV